MRLTFSDQISFCQKGAGNDTTTASQTFFKESINRRDVECLSVLPSHLSETVRTFSTVASQQYYHTPPNINRIKSVTITINSVIYPLVPVHSYLEWKKLNAITIQAGAIPRRYFKRQRDFGVWPIPQGAYTGTIDYSFHGGGLVRTDYTAGTVTTTQNDATVTNGGASAWSTTSNVMADDWFVVTDSNGLPRGSWYRIGSVTDATNLELESVWEESAESAVTYKIGQTSELPEDGHILPAYGALSDYYLSLRQNVSRAKVWSNMYWTGDPSISRSQAESSSKPWTGGGLLGLVERYRDRNESQTIDRSSGRDSGNDKNFATVLS